MLTHPSTIGIEVVYAQDDRAIVRSYQVAVTVTIGEVLKLAAADPAFAGIDVQRSSIGIFGRPAQPHESLAQGDRIEIYRALAADPKIARRARVQLARRKPRSA